jgi:hypothetical protein
MGGGSFWLSKQVISKVLSGYNLLGWTTEPPSSEQCLTPWPSSDSIEVWPLPPWCQHYH